MASVKLLPLTPFLKSPTITTQMMIAPDKLAIKATIAGSDQTLESVFTTGSRTN